MLVALGSHRFDITHRAIVVGAVDPAVERPSETFLGEALRLAAAGADVLEVGDTGGAAMDVIASAVRSLRARTDLPVAVRTARTSVARACFDAGAVLAAGHAPAEETGLVEAVAAAGASVVLTAGPAVAGVDESPSAVEDRARGAEVAGVPAERIIVDGGAGPGRSEDESLARLRHQDALARAGRPVLVDVVAPPYLQVAAERRRPLVTAAIAVSVVQGARIVRAADVRAARRVVEVTARLLEARASAASEGEMVS